MQSSNPTVSDYMVSPVESVRPDVSVSEVGDLFVKHGVSALPVVDEQGTLVGVISRSDLVRRSIAPPGVSGDTVLSIPRAHVAELMHETVQVVDPSVSLERAARRMAAHNHHRLFVLDDNQLVGVLSTKEMVRAAMDSPRAIPVRELMSTDLVEVRIEDPVGLAVDRMAAVGLRGVVVTQDGAPIGIFSQPEALRSRGADPQAPVAHFTDPHPVVIPATAAASRAAELMMEHDVRYAIVVEDQRAVGIITGTDFARMLGGLA